MIVRIGLETRKLGSNHTYLLHLHDQLSATATFTGIGQISGPEQDLRSTLWLRNGSLNSFDIGGAKACGGSLVLRTSESGSYGS
jgi:hypothetical protein